MLNQYLKALIKCSLTSGQQVRRQIFAEEHPRLAVPAIIPLHPAGRSLTSPWIKWGGEIGAPWAGFDGFLGYNAQFWGPGINLPCPGSSEVKDTFAKHTRFPLFGKKNPEKTLLPKKTPLPTAVPPKPSFIH